jgi:hypothetical protein
VANLAAKEIEIYARRELTTLGADGHAIEAAAARPQFVEVSAAQAHVRSALTAFVLNSGRPEHFV